MTRNRGFTFFLIINNKMYSNSQKKMELEDDIKAILTCIDVFTTHIVFSFTISNLLTD